MRRVTLLPSHIPITHPLPAISEVSTNLRPTHRVTFVIPPHPAVPPWSHDHFVLHNPQKPYTQENSALQTQNYSYKILLHTDICHIPGLILGLHAIYTHSGLILSDFTYSRSARHASILALISAICRLPSPKFVIFFFNDASFPSYCTNRSNFQNLPYTSSLIHYIDDYLT
jgi:hypothetical protein